MGCFYDTVSFTLDENRAEYKSGHCWLPNQMEETINSIKNGFSSHLQEKKFQH